MRFYLVHPVRWLAIAFIIAAIILQMNMVAHFWQSFGAGDELGGQLLVYIGVVLALIEVVLFPVADISKPKAVAGAHGSPAWSSSFSRSSPALSIAGRFRASTLAASTEVIKCDWEPDPWGAWRTNALLTRDDGLWLSDGTDLYPHAARQHILQNIKGEPKLPMKPRAVAAVAGFGGRAVSDRMTLSASWKSPDDVHISIRSALIARRGAFSRVQRLARGPRHRCWLPVLEGADEDQDARYNRDTPFEPWIVDIETHPKLDDHDPFGARSAAERPRLSAKAAASLALHAVDQFGRTWCNTSGEVIIRIPAWGRRRGMGRYEDNDYAYSMDCVSGAVVEYLRSTNQKLVLQVSMTRYPKRGRYDDDYQVERALVMVLVSGVGTVKVIPGRTIDKPKRVRRRQIRRTVELPSWFNAVENADELLRS
jgi:hypothetical protein